MIKDFFDNMFNNNNDVVDEEKIIEELENFEENEAFLAKYVFAYGNCK